MGKMTQANMILQLLQQKPRVTTGELRHFGGWRYNARLYDLRAQGHIIVRREKITNGYTYEYLGFNESGDRAHAFITEI